MTIHKNIKISVKDFLFKISYSKYFCANKSICDKNSKCLIKISSKE